MNQIGKGVLGKATGGRECTGVLRPGRGWPRSLLGGIPQHAKPREETPAIIILVKGKSELRSWESDPEDEHIYII